MDLFAKKLLAWFDLHGRKQLPWQNPRSGYFVWVSEIMLQQTQVATVIDYFNRFIKRFPCVATLARASLDEVLVYWAGLGYYSRAKNLHRCAQIIHTQYADQFPAEVNILKTLPGIGPSTAGALIAQAFNQYAVILDGNVKRVLSRYHAVPGALTDRQTIDVLWQFATKHTPHQRLADYTQAIMDLGALICTRSKPKCLECPLNQSCAAYNTNQITKFPEKKQPQSLPKRSQFFLLCVDPHQQILMEKQPEKGIWANLWSLPSAVNLKKCPLRLTDIAHKKNLPPIEHRFTHFQLTLKPIFIQLSCTKKIFLTSCQQWIAIDQLHTIGMPAPIKKLLMNIINAGQVE